MATSKPFPYAGFLGQLEHISAATPLPLPLPLAHILLAADGITPAAMHLIPLLKAREAMLQASLGTNVVADALRRYQKFARPGPPSPHIVQLRQQQAAARQAMSRSRQSFIKAAAAFLREAGIDVPRQVALEMFMIGWIDANIPQDPATP